MYKTLNIVMVMLMLTGAGWTFMIKHKSELAREDVSRLEREIAYEKEEIDLLKADWALLNNPERLEEMVKRFSGQLDLKIVEPDQVITLENLPEYKLMSGGGGDLREAARATDRTITGSIIKGDRPGKDKSKANGRGSDMLFTPIVGGQR